MTDMRRGKMVKKILIGLSIMLISTICYAETPNVYDEILYQQDVVQAKQEALQKQAKKIQQQIQKLQQDYAKVLNNLYYSQGAKDILEDVDNA